MSRLVSELFGTLEGRSVAVIGGGASSLDDLAQLPSDVVIIAVNYHCNDLLEPDYVVALDKGTYKWMKHENAKTVGPFEMCDFITHDQGKQLLTAGSFKSAHKAVDFGIQMGAKNVYLCGIDCYTGVKPYLNSDMTWEEWTVDEHHRRSIRPLDQKVCVDRWFNAFGKYRQVKPVTEFLRGRWNGF